MSTPRIALTLTLIALSGCSQEKKPGGLTAGAALETLRFSEDFHAETFASEPNVMDPVDMVFDDRGRAFVAEMHDLPDDPPEGKPALGRIRMLEDTNGDGKADKATVFAENVMHCSGLIPWKGGLIVPVSPEILYLKDTDGDGKADVREVWFTGFFHGNPEAQISNPRLGVDNWIYFSNTGNAGLVKSPKHPGHPAVQLRGYDFRYHPVKGIFEPVSGTAQYGATFDDFGNRFISQNTVHLRHVVLPQPYLARAPMLEVPTTMQDVYFEHDRRMFPLTPVPEWRAIRTRLRQQRYDELKTGRVEHAAGYITGAAGSTMYHGDAWPEGYKGSIFTGDVSANLVRRDVITPEGVTFRARPAKEEVEFLASTDPWFRPTNFANAPDGNLYVMDMQREVIETPVSIPDELRKKLDFYSGDKMGRIYRIASNQPRTQRGLTVNLGALSSMELAGLLEHDNGWHRETAHRLLLERQDKTVAPRLIEIATGGKSAAGRVRALWLLESLGALDAATVAKALGDERPEIREHAIRLAEAFPALESRVVALARDESVRVQMQAALSLGNSKSAAARNAVVEVAARNIEDHWIGTAALSSAAGAPTEFLAAVMRKAGAGKVPKEMLGAVGSLVGTRQQPAEVLAFVRSLAASTDPGAGLDGLARGLTQVGARNLRAPGVDAALAKYLNAGEESAWNVASHFEMRGLVDRAVRDALSEKTPAASRRLAVLALRGADFGRARDTVAKLLATNPPAEIQSAAVLALSSFEGPEVAPALLSHWKTYAPDTRPKAIGAMLARKDRVPLLLDAIEKGEIPANALEINARNRLLETQDKVLAARVRKILGTPGDRAGVVASHKDALSLAGSVDRGKQVFEDACAKCHLPRREGARVGPDLAGINMKTKEELLTAILDPSASIEPRYVNYLVTTKDGRMFDGVLASETAGAVTLRGGSEQDVTIPRSQIAEIRSSNISLMPEEIEKTIGKQGLADVIAYLQGGL
ncbi:MAG: c-type cytochrome [Bryobacteraceae bacterium]